MDHIKRTKRKKIKTGCLGTAGGEEKGEIKQEQETLIEFS